jgi:peptidyl-prolyl cis-trans isomerase D
MIEVFHRRDLWVRVMMGVVIGVIGIMMLVTLIPGPLGSTGSSPDAVANVGGKDITAADVTRELGRIERGGQNIPRQLRGLYTKEIVDRLIFQHLVELEAQQLGLRVTDQERAEQIKQMFPDVFSGGTVSSMEAYATQVQQRTAMTVPEFEELLRQALLETKIRRLVTDGVTVSLPEIVEEFTRRNQKVKLEYVSIKPSELEAKVSVSDADLSSFFEKNKSRYQIPERRSFKYALLDLAALRGTARPSEADLQAYYNQNIEQYRAQNRVHVSHILFKTGGKTDAEVEEIRKRAEEVLAKLKKGAKFEDLAKQYSEDTSKDRGGDLGWIMEKMTVPEFERAAFSLKKGEISGLVKSTFGFHVIKLIDREEARTKTLEEVRASILPILANQLAEQKANDISDRMASAIRQSNRTALEELARQFTLQAGSLPPVSATDPLGPLGNSPEVRQFIFGARPGEDSSPLRVDRGYVIVSVAEIQPARQGTLAEVRPRVDSDYRAEQSVTLARQRAEELAKRVQGGETLAAAAKALSFEVATSDLLSETDSLSGVGPMRKMGAAFTLPVGQSAPALFLGSNWVVYRVAERQEPNPLDLAKQKQQIEHSLLTSRQGMAYQAFREALKERMSREGKLHINVDVLKRLTSIS